MTTTASARTGSLASVVLLALFLPVPARAEAPRLTLNEMVSPSAVFMNKDQPVMFAIDGLVEFKTLADLFDYVDVQAGRWTFGSDQARQAFGDALLKRGVESRLISMEYETPLELLLTHTRRELAAAASTMHTADGALVYRGRHWRLSTAVYREAFLRVQSRWTSALNCWSASPSIPARVLSNWYIIDEGITLYGGTYDSTEHFWQGIKYHPDVRVLDLLAILKQMDDVNWTEWLGKLDADQPTALGHEYAIAFLRANLTRARSAWFREQLAPFVAENPLVRTLQQRRTDGQPGPRFAALTEKIVWGDLADQFHLVQFFATLDRGRFRARELEPVLDLLSRFHFDAVYLPGYGSGRMGFISPEFRRLMPEIWKVKYLQIERLGDVIRSTAGVKLDHFLNDGDSPDIPLTVYRGYLNQIRELALQRRPAPVKSPSRP